MWKANASERRINYLHFPKNEYLPHAGEAPCLVRTEDLDLGGILVRAFLGLSGGKRRGDA